MSQNKGVLVAWGLLSSAGMAHNDDEATARALVREWWVENCQYLLKVQGIGTKRCGLAMPSTVEATLTQRITAALAASPQERDDARQALVELQVSCPVERERADVLQGQLEVLAASRAEGEGQVAALREELATVHRFWHRDPHDPCTPDTCATAEVLADTAAAAQAHDAPVVRETVQKVLGVVQLQLDKEFNAAVVCKGDQNYDIATQRAAAVKDVLDAIRALRDDEPVR